MHKIVWLAPTINQIILGLEQLLVLNKSQRL